MARTEGFSKAEGSLERPVGSVARYYQWWRTQCSTIAQYSALGRLRKTHCGGELLARNAGMRINIMVRGQFQSGRFVWDNVVDGDSSGMRDALAV
eukprot:IDg21646t1